MCYFNQLKHIVKYRFFVHQFKYFVIKNYHYLNEEISFLLE